MSRPIVITSAVGASIGLVVASVATGEYRLGSPTDPGPGFYPVLVGLLLILGSVGAGIEAWRGESQEDISWPGHDAFKRVGVIAGSLVVYAVTLVRFGYPIMTALLVALVLRIMGMSNWLVILITAIAMSLGSYYLFRVLLGVPLPVGPFRIF